MSLLRDDRLAQLNELLLRCEDAALRYRDAAELAPDRHIGELLGALAEEREAAARRLDHHIRDLGDLPDALDTDRESLRRVSAMARAAISEDRESLNDYLREHAAQLEEGVAAQAERTLKTGIAGSVRTTVQQLLDSSHRNCGRLLH